MPLRQIRSAIGAAAINPELLTSASGWSMKAMSCRGQTNAAILALSNDRAPIKQIARQTGHSRKLVQLRGERKTSSGFGRAPSKHICHGWIFSRSSHRSSGKT
jgi:hypothetical protein